MGTFAAFISHSFSVGVPAYMGVLEMAERQGLAFINKSVPAWDPLDARGRGLAAALDERIRWSSVVIVLVTESLHNAAWTEFEIDTARKYGKPIIAVYPNGEFGSPMPRTLNDGLYRAIGWRGNALEKAIRGEYPPDARIFDIAEDVERREGVRLAVGAAAGAVLLFAGATQAHVAELKSELLAAGLPVPSLSRADYVVPWALGGGVAGLLLDALLGGRGAGLLVGTLAGAGLGAGAGLVHHAHAELRQLGPLLELRRVETGALTA